MKRRPQARTNEMHHRDHLQIALRAYVPSRNGKAWRPVGAPQGPSEWTLVFDTETTTGASQSLRFGAYQVYKAQQPFDAGLFFSPEAFTLAERRLIESYARKNNLRAMDVREFVEKIFYGIGYDLRATIVGFNPPFDISRLAIRHG